jgi:phospholipid/cholesterol/gamma-HCH transport system substrate-binding protein
MRSVSTVGRVAALGAVIAAVVLVALVLFGGGKSGYTLTATFLNAGQIVKGNPVQTGGAPIGSVKDIKITPDGHAEIKLTIKDKFAPVPKGTRAAIRQFSQSGIANRYVDLSYPDDKRQGNLASGSNLGTDRTTTAVDLDELFDTLDPSTRKALQNFFKGNARQFHAAGADANSTFQYLNPALSTSSRLFNELDRDQPTLDRFLVKSSQLVTTLAQRRDDLAALVGNLNDTTRALGNQKAALAESIQRLPPFMRRANTTFVNLRAALNDVDPLVDASKPVAARLQPFLAQARGFAADAKPTVRDLRKTVSRPGANNDLINLVNTVPRLADIAVESKKRDNKVRRGAFPEAVDAFKGGAPIIAQARPYSSDFIGWLDDFSTTGGGFDAMGAYARAQLSFAENLGGPIKQGQFKRCPGSAEEVAPDGSNVASAAEASTLDCDRFSRATGNTGP